MNSDLTYRGYSARVAFDARDSVFVGHVLGVRDRITFHGSTVDELRSDFEAAVDHYLADCALTGRIPEKPASGRLMLRIPPQVHAAAAVRAEAVGKSLNQWATEVIAAAAGS
jgi:predicted HicB family RNase H-like nuclease